jgi:perosamine synthetase
MNYLKPISISLSPNTEPDDVWLALKLIFRPKSWHNWEKNKELEEDFKKYLGVAHATPFNSGRSALMAILDSLELKKNSEILLQAFTCNAAANPIIWSGLKPIYVDCDEMTLNIDVEDLKKKITPKSKAVMIQHTFGLPADINEILEICQKNNLILIEDCAHSLGATQKGKKIGTFGKAAFFSFGRDKVISSVYGGMVVTNDDNLAEKIRKYQKSIKHSSHFWIFQQLLHPILMNWLILPTYKILGKYLLVLFQWLQVLTKAVHWKEKIGEKPNYFPKRLPNNLAVLVLNQLKKLERFNQHRQEIAEFYNDNLRNLDFILPKEYPGRVYMRYSILAKNYNTDKILKEARKKRIFLDDNWRKTPIVPPDTNQEKLGYISGSCSNAEKVAKNILNLPTHINISKKEAEIIVEFLK